MEGKPIAARASAAPWCWRGSGCEQAHFSGIVEGRIIDGPAGAAGFGYDPLFIPDGHEQTFAELGEEVKNTLSHRSGPWRRCSEYLDTQQIKIIYISLIV
jgi:XTP/dITP diphosphohydrolase